MAKLTKRDHNSGIPLGVVVGVVAGASVLLGLTILATIHYRLRIRRLHRQQQCNAISETIQLAHSPNLNQSRSTEIRLHTASPSTSRSITDSSTTLVPSVSPSVHELHAESTHRPSVSLWKTQHPFSQPSTTTIIVTPPTPISPVRSLSEVFSYLPSPRRIITKAAAIISERSGPDSPKRRIRRIEGIHSLRRQHRDVDIEAGILEEDSDDENDEHLQLAIAESFRPSPPIESITAFPATGTSDPSSPVSPDSGPEDSDVYESRQRTLYLDLSTDQELNSLDLYNRVDDKSSDERTTLNQTHECEDDEDGEREDKETDHAFQQNIHNLKRRLEKVRNRTRMGQLTELVLLEGKLKMEIMEEERRVRDRT